MAVKDSFERRIDYLRISVTDRCNLKCVYCMPEKGLRRFDDAEILTSGEIVRAVKIASRFGIRKVRITGGEPLLRSDIIQLVRAVKEVGIRDVSITTNGMLLAGMAEALKDAGLDRINISLDTLRAERFGSITRGGDLDRVWEGIRKAEEAGLYPVKLNVVPMRGTNDDELLDFAALTFEKDYHIRFIELMPGGNGKNWSRDSVVGKEEIMDRISELGSLQPLKSRGKGPSRNYRIKGAKGVLGFISAISDHFCDSCNRLRLTSRGMLRPCLFSATEIDLRTPMREGASDDELRDLFASAVTAKPRGHSLNENDGDLRGLPTMSKIGG
jgi:cyclic pyranopterin phosphate synthase